jgi:hypothetical protein
MTLSSTLRLPASVKCWCTMPTPASIAARGRPGGSVLAEDMHIALVRRVVAEEDVHQRCLARAVLAQKREDLPRLQVERDRVIGRERPETLGDPVEV